MTKHQRIGLFLSILGISCFLDAISSIDDFLLKTICVIAFGMVIVVGEIMFLKE